MAGDSDDVDEAYRPPQADEGELGRSESDADVAPFYVVSIPKLVFLQLGTLGTYQLYWFYRHWRAQRQAFGLDVMPWARALFSIFFVRRLFKAIDGRAREADHEPTWDAGAQATVYIAIAVGSSLLSRFAGGGVPGMLVGIAIRLATVLPLVAAQKVANVASDDPEGASNAGIDVGSVIAVLLILAFWGSMFWYLAALTAFRQHGF